MPPVMQDPRFTANSYSALNQLEQRIRDRVYSLLRDRLGEQGRAVITEKDVAECFAEACRQSTEACGSPK